MLLTAQGGAGGAAADDEAGVEADAHVMMDDEAKLHISAGAEIAEADVEGTLKLVLGRVPKLILKTDADAEAEADI